MKFGHFQIVPQGAFFVCLFLWPPLKSGRFQFSKSECGRYSHIQLYLQKCSVTKLNNYYNALS